MEVTFTPAICNGEEADFSGQITMKMPTYDERLEIYEALGLDFDGQVNEQAKSKGITLMRIVAKKLPQYIIKVDIKRKADGFHFDSLEKLQYDSDMVSVLQECSFKLIGKFNIANPSIPH